MNHGSFVPFFVRSFHGILIRMSKTEDDDVKEEELRKIFGEKNIIILTQCSYLPKILFGQNFWSNPNGCIRIADSLPVFLDTRCSLIESCVV